MLDKTIPYHRVIMTRKTGNPIPATMLPEGFSFRLFQFGDEHALDYGPFNNEYEQAIPLLKQVLRPSCLPHIQTEDQQHA